MEEAIKNDYQGNKYIITTHTYLYTKKFILRIIWTASNESFAAWMSNEMKF